MRKLIAATITLAAAAFAMTTPAAAFHGAFWLANGTAVTTLPVVGVTTFDASVHWSGQQVGGTGTIKVELRDPDSHLLLHSNSFSSRESWGNVWFPNGCLEMVEPYHQVAVAGPGVFQLDGVMRNDLCTNTATDDYLGHYGVANTIVFALDVHVRGFDHG